MSITGYERDFYHHVQQISKTLLDMAKTHKEIIPILQKEITRQNELLDKIVNRLERLADNQH